MKKILLIVFLLIAAACSAFAQDATYYNSVILGHNIPLYARKGETRRVSVIVMNTANNTWTNSDGYKLGTCNAVNGGSDGPAPFSASRINIPNGTSVAKGQIYIFSFDMTFNSSGSTIYRMVHEGHTWFGSGISVSVTVLDSAPFVWDVTGAPSTSSSTNGVWTFGWYTPSASSTSFTAYNMYATDGSDKAWRNSENWDYHGYVGYRDANSIRTDYSQLRLPYTMYMGSAGLSGGTAAKGWSTVRFTAPCGGTFYFSTRFSPSGKRTANVNGSNTSGATIYIKKNHSSSNLYTDTRNGSIYGGGTFQTINTSSNTYERAFSQSLNKGDTIDLIDNSYQANNSCGILDLFRVYCASPKITVSGTIKSSYNSGGISGAQIKSGSTVVATADSDGKYSFEVNYGTSAVSYTVSASGYSDGTLSVTPNAVTVSKDVTLTAVCTISGMVSDANGAVSGAKVVINGTTLTTNSSGVYSITVNRSSSAYSMTITAPGHSDKSDSVTTNNNSAVTKNISLTRANVFYVNFNQGNNNNNGITVNTPWKDFTNVNSIGRSGDTVYMCGTSSSTVTLTNKSGITVKPYKSTYNATYQGCTINAPDGAYGIVLSGCSNITIDGARKDDNLFGYIEIKDASSADARGGVSISGSNNCVIRNLNIHNLNDGGTKGECEAFWIEGDSTGNKIVRNFIYQIGSDTKNTSKMDAAVCGGSTHSSGTANYFAYNTVLNVGNITRAWHTDHLYVSNNICSNVRGCNPDTAFSGGSLVTTSNNLIYQWTATNKYDSGVTSSGDQWGVDPKLSSYTSAGYDLNSTSPAINIGTDASTLLPSSGMGALSGTAADLGCKEFTGTPQCLVSVKVQSNYSGNPVIEGATATVNGTAKTTGSNGIAGTFTVNRGTAYTAAVTNAPAHSDGTSASFTPSATEAAKTITVTLTKGNAFYVNFDSGDDGKTGLSGYPWKTFTHVSTWAKAGDTVNVTGTSTNAYSGTTFPTMTGCNGTSSSPIIVKPYNTGAVFTATASAGTRGIQLENCSYVIIDGAMNNTFGRFEFTVAERGVNLNNCNHCVVKNCNIHDINSDGATEGAGIREFNGSHHNTYIRNLINKVGIANSKLNGAFTSGGNPEPQSTVFAYNTVNDATNGVRVWNGYAEGTTAKSHVVVKNNIFSNIRGGCGENQSAVFHADWRNDELDGNITAENNIITSGYYKQYDYMDGTSQTNLWDVDPLFTSASNFVPLGYSPAVDAGNDTAIFATAGITSGVGYPAGYAPDMGCYEVSTPQYRLTGTVTSGYDNTPISGATVTVNGTDYTTDANGVYTIIVNRPANAGSGTYTVTVSADGHAGDSASVTATTAVPTQTQDFELTAQCVVSGKVTDGYGNVAGAVIKDALGNTVATTDASGDYSFTVDRSATRMPVTVSAANHVNLNVSLDISGATLSYDFNLAALTTVSGTVTSSFDGSPVSGATVNIGLETTTTDAEGNYSLVVPSSDLDYTVTAAATGFANYSGTVVTSGFAVTNNFVMTERNTVNITVISTYDNKPVTGAAVTVAGTACTEGAGGVYTATVDRAADYAVSVTKSGFNGYSGTTDDSGKPTADTVELNKIVSSVAELLGAADGATVETDFDLVVTNSKGIFPGSVVYAQSEDRLRGVKMVLGDDTMLLGDRVRVVGTVAADGTGKKLIVTDVPTDVSGDAPDTLGLAKSNLTNYVLVRVWGTVKSVSGSTFTVFNGNKTFTCIAPEGAAPAVGSIVSVTGIATPDGVLMRGAVDCFRLK